MVSVPEIITVRALFDTLNKLKFGGTLSRYHLKFSKRMVRTLGRINFSRKTITLSWNLLEQHGWKEIEDTLLHEMTHAFLFERGEKIGHTKKFYDELLKRGGTRESKEVLPRKHHLYVCPVCGHKYVRIRKIGRKSISCGVCDKSYNPNKKLEYKGVYYTNVDSI